MALGLGFSLYGVDPFSKHCKLVYAVYGGIKLEHPYFVGDAKGPFLKIHIWGSRISDKVVSGCSGHTSLLSK